MISSPGILVKQLHHFVVGGLRLGAALGGSTRHTVAEMIAQQLPAHRPQGLLSGGDLAENIGAIPILLHHASDTPDLTFDPIQPPQIRLLDVRIHGDTAPAFRFVCLFFDHASYLYPLWVYVKKEAEKRHASAERCSGTAGPLTYNVRFIFRSKVA